ncbi:vacuolar protein sorting-associated protein 52 [Musa troglodytarum]|uniref:Vacuolar protein sorting-associated protein 52 n=1 Tax=Musa troglodytarum TaxID=320322 RepID=A0A9E7GX95_9LILI|nr:vacuolar protein sorting-associated protein 52 [Musa troglodytarum]
MPTVMNRRRWQSQPSTEEEIVEYIHKYPSSSAPPWNRLSASDTDERIRARAGDRQGTARKEGCERDGATATKGLPTVEEMGGGEGGKWHNKNEIKPWFLLISRLLGVLLRPRSPSPASSITPPTARIDARVHCRSHIGTRRRRGSGWYIVLEWWLLTLPRRQRPYFNRAGQPKFDIGRSPLFSRQRRPPRGNSGDKVLESIVAARREAETSVRMQDNEKQTFDLGLFVGDLALDEDGSSDDISLEGLQEELEECKNVEEVANILSKGTKLREYTKGVENNVRQVELDSIQDYITESDNLVLLHDQIRDCDIILSQMETVLSGFQSEIGSISSEIKSLQEKSMDMGLKLKNRKGAESKLAKFVEDIIVPPRMVDIVIDGEVNDEYLRTLELLSRKLKFIEVDSMVKGSKALKDIQPELERLRQKVVAKVFEFITQKFNALRKPKTNIQILQQSVLLKYKYVILFLKEHGKEIYTEVRAAYVDTMNKVLSVHFRAYIQALEKLQLDIATATDLIGVETRSTGFLLRGREPLKYRSAVFALGERINILKEIDQPALIPHIAEANSVKYPYEVLFRSLHKLLMDTATSEYLFCDDFFGEESIFHEIFAGPFQVIDEHFNTILPNYYDAIGLMLMIRIIHQHQLIMFRRRIPCLDSYLDKVNISLWPRFKMVFDMHLNSLRNANIRALWEDDVHPHYVMRRYAEFTASLVHLNVEYGDGQLDLNLERLRMAVDDLLVKLAKAFAKPKSQTVFLINNYDMTIAILKEAGTGGGKLQEHFEELLKSNIGVYVEELLLEHFAEDTSTGAGKPRVADVDPLVKDFANRWKAAIELMHKDVITSFSNFLCGMEILKAALTQLLLYYTRLSESVKKIPGGSALNKDLVSISSILYEIKKYSRTF